MKKVRWGIVGTGNIANKFAQAVKNADGGVLTAVASRNEHTAVDFAKRHNIENYFSSYEKMAESEKIDAVYIASPHAMHSQNCKLFLNSGKHILCEKPITINNFELTELRSLSKAKGLFLMEAMWTRFLPAIIELQKVIADGVIGKVTELSADFCINAKPGDNRLFRNDLGGGSILDVGVYPITFANIIFGDNLIDIKSSVIKNNDIDERHHSVLMFKDGEIARVSSALTLSKPYVAYIYGENGYIKVPNFFMATDFEVIKNNGTEIKKYHFGYKGNGFEEEIEEANRSILSGKLESEIHPLSKSSTIMQIMDEIRKQTEIYYPADKK